jgi:phosphocarrier protein HPr
MTINHTFTVMDPIGIHARPVGQIVTLVRESGATVTLRNSEGKEASAASALKMLAMKVKSGESLELVIDAEDDAAGHALAEAIEALVNEG